MIKLFTGWDIYSSKINLLVLPFELCDGDSVLFRWHRRTASSGYLLAKRMSTLIESISGKQYQIKARDKSVGQSDICCYLPIPLFFRGNDAEKHARGSWLSIHSQWSWPFRCTGVITEKTSDTAQNAGSVITDISGREPATFLSFAVLFSSLNTAVQLRMLPLLYLDWLSTGIIHYLWNPLHPLTNSPI